MATRTATTMEPSEVVARRVRRSASVVTRARRGRAEGSPHPARTKDDIRQLHDFGASPQWKFAFDTVVFLVLAAAAALLWTCAWWPVTIAVWLVAGHFGHTKPLAFHDAAHGTLHPRRWVNEALGLFAGTIILVPLTVYRFGHALHHNHLSTLRDPEMWPFVDPAMPRPLRMLAAVLEILFGFLYTPMLFLRYFLIADDIPAKARRRIGLEYAVIVLNWSAVLGIVHVTGLWELFLVAYVAPVAVAGTLQSLNKYTEHMGLVGSGVLANTRTVADRCRFGRWLAYSMQNVVHHGTHHRYAKIPYHHLPAATPYVFSTGTPSSGTGQPRVFTTYRSALFDMLKTLADPKAGAQWSR